MKAVCAVVAGVLSVSGCSFDNLENPYRGLEPAPAAGTILEDLNLASLGLRSYQCDLFNASLSRCYAPDHWLGVREGRETLGYIHRDLVASGARFWGSSDSPTTDLGAPKVAGLDLGCYYDYETGDLTLRLVIVGPSGEAEPCINGLPGDGVSEVWIIGASFTPEKYYGGVVEPEALKTLLLSLPPRVVRPDDVYGGALSTVEGYYGPELPRQPQAYGVHILPETVTVTNGIARGLVQYGGVQPSFLPSGEPSAGETADLPEVAQETTAAIGVVVRVGHERYEIPIVIRAGESAPFEIALPAGFDTNDLKIVPGWNHTNVDWRGGQRLSGPVSDPLCGEGVGEGGATVVALIPGGGEECLVFEAQATTTAGARIEVGAVVATFAADGTIVEVTEPFILVNGVEPEMGQSSVIFPDLRIAWRAPTGSAASTGVWIRYAKQSDLDAA